MKKAPALSIYTNAPSPSERLVPWMHLAEHGDPVSSNNLTPKTARVPGLRSAKCPQLHQPSLKSIIPPFSAFRRRPGLVSRTRCSNQFVAPVPAAPAIFGHTGIPPYICMSGQNFNSLPKARARRPRSMMQTLTKDVCKKTALVT